MVEISWNPDARVHVLTSSVTLPASRHDVFDFFSDAFRLEDITPPWLKFRVTTPAPIAIEAGTLIDYRLQLRGVPIRWRSEISRWQPPGSFTDRQVRGPYSLWEHRHAFESVDGGTRVTDTVSYRAPGGRFVNWLLVERQLRQIFEYRHDRMREIFASAFHA